MKAACWMLLLAVGACLPAVAVPAVDAEHARALDDAQFEDWLAGQRTVLREQRDAAQARYHQAEFECWRRFAVNDCLYRARVARRGTLDALLEEQLRLNAMERERRAARRARSIAGKDAPAPPPPDVAPASGD